MHACLRAYLSVHACVHAYMCMLVFAGACLCLQLCPCVFALACLIERLFPHHRMAAEWCTVPWPQSNALPAVHSAVSPVQGTARSAALSPAVFCLAVPDVVLQHALGAQQRVHHFRCSRGSGAHPLGMVSAAGHRARIGTRVTRGRLVRFLGAIPAFSDIPACDRAHRPLASDISAATREGRAAA